VRPRPTKSCETETKTNETETSVVKCMKEVQNAGILLTVFNISKVFSMINLFYTQWNWRQV